MKNFFPPVLALVFCISIFWKWTLGFSAFTVFSHTLDRAGDLPRSFPNLKMIDQDSALFQIEDKNKYILLNFVYLNCPYVCHKINNRLEDIYLAIDNRVIPTKLELVTVSFDLKNDHVQKIKNYRNHFNNSIQGWTFALPWQMKQHDLESYLQKVGVWAKSTPGSTIINHSVYLFLISPEHKIVRTFDPTRESNQAIIDQLYLCLKE